MVAQKQKILLFDFDSTLVAVESLEFILDKFLLNQNHQLIEKFQQLTISAMNGEMSFAESLTQRLNLVAFTQGQIQQYIPALADCISADAKQVLTQLQEEHICWVVSGGISQIISPIAKQLGFSRVISVNLQPDQNQILRLDQNDPSVTGKIVALQAYKQHLVDCHVTIIGDGYTDYKLFEAGVAQRFIAYVEHIKRDFLADINCEQATTMRDLQKILNYGTN